MQGLLSLLESAASGFAWYYGGEQLKQDDDSKSKKLMARMSTLLKGSLGSDFWRGRLTKN